MHLSEENQYPACVFQMSAVCELAELNVLAEVVPSTTDYCV